MLSACVLLMGFAAVDTAVKDRTVAMSTHGMCLKNVDEIVFVFVFIVFIY